MNQIKKQTIEEYAVYLKENDKSSSTISKYTNALRHLMDYMDGAEISRQALLDYRDSLLESKKPQTINGDLSAIRGYLKFLGLEEYKVNFLKVQHQVFCPEERELNRDEFTKLIQAAQAQKRERLLLVMETICSTGMRVSEVHFVTMEAVRMRRTEISLKGKIRVIMMPEKLCRKLLEYAGQQGITSGEIFLTRRGHSFSRQQIWAEMKSLCKAAGVEPTKVFPHNLRHLFARCFYEESQDVVKLADVLGHSSIETTRIYLKSDGAEHAKLLDCLNLVS